MRALARAVRFRVAGATLTALVALTGCRAASDAASGKPRPSRAFCEAAARFDERVPVASLAEQIRLVRRLVDTAPADVRPQARTFLAALERVRTDPSVKDDPEIERAVDDLNRRAGQDCGWYRRRGL